MNEAIDTTGLLMELEKQPEGIRKIFFYAICQTMVEAGLLDFLGASTVEGVGTMLMYRNPDSNQVFEITKPDMDPQDEDSMRTHIRQLLEKQAI